MQIPSPEQRRPPGVSLAGNNGEEQGPPGTAKNAICVGATQADPNEMNWRRQRRADGDGGANRI
jgi:hypothetical protein